MHIHALQEKACTINFSKFSLSQSTDALVSFRLDLLLAYFASSVNMNRKLWIFCTYKCSLTW